MKFQAAVSWLRKTLSRCWELRAKEKKTYQATKLELTTAVSVAAAELLSNLLLSTIDIEFVDKKYKPHHDIFSCVWL